MHWMPTRLPDVHDTSRSWVQYICAACHISTQLESRHCLAYSSCRLVSTASHCRLLLQHLCLCAQHQPPLVVLFHQPRHLGSMKLLTARPVSLKYASARARVHPLQHAQPQGVVRLVAVRWVLGSVFQKDFCSATVGNVYVSGSCTRALNVSMPVACQDP